MLLPAFFGPVPARSLSLQFAPSGVGARDEASGPQTILISKLTISISILNISMLVKPCLPRRFQRIFEFLHRRSILPNLELYSHFGFYF